MKLAIVGSRYFTDVEKVRKVVAMHIARYDDLIIVSGGAEGADKIGKDLAVFNGIKYVEFPPFHKPHNEYCILPPERYGKPYNVSHFFERNTLIAEYADRVAAFVIKDVKSNGTMDTINKAKKLGKLVFLFQSES